MASRALRAFQLGSGLARALPGPVLDGVVRVASRAVVPLAGERRRQVERNLRRVHGPSFGGLALRRAVGDTFESYGRYWAESFRLPGTSPERLDRAMRVDRWDSILEAREQGRGVILALPHLGPWEWAGFWAAVAQDIPVTVVVEALEPADVYEWFASLRESFGLHVLPLGPSVGAEALAALHANHILALLCDRDISGGGVEVEFFGERTTLPAGPATLALRTGAPLFPAAIYDEQGTHHGVVRPALDTSRRGRLREDVARVTQDLARELEALIRHAPEQWHLLQPNWPSDRTVP